MSPYEQKMDALRALIEEHNEVIRSTRRRVGGDCGQDLLDVDSIIDTLIAMGGSSEASLNAMKFEDLEVAGLPRVLARRVATEIFRVRAEASVSTWSTEALLAAYNPDDLVSGIAAPVLAELRARFGTRRFILFTPEGRYDATASMEALRLTALSEATGTPVEHLFELNGTLVPLYPLGERPLQVVDTSPFAPERPLVGSRCAVTHQDMAEIPRSVRQFLALVVEAGLIRVTDRHAVTELCRIAADDGELLELGKLYPDVMQTYRERLCAETLPRLRLESRPETKRPNPFMVPSGHRRF